MGNERELIADAIDELKGFVADISHSLESDDGKIVDVVGKLAYATKRVADSITPIAFPGTDETGGRVESLTEAVMGVTAGLCQIASAIESLAEAIREKG